MTLDEWLDRNPALIFLTYTVAVVALVTVILFGAQETRSYTIVRDSVCNCTGPVSGLRGLSPA